MKRITLLCLLSINMFYAVAQTVNQQEYFELNEVLPARYLDFSMNGIARAKDKTSNGGLINQSDKGYNVSMEDEYGGGDHKFFLSAG